MNAPMSWEEAVAWLRQQPGMTELVRACYFDDPLPQAAQRFLSSPEWAGIRDLLPKPGTALDIGAGRGVAAYALASCGWSTVALEPDNSALVGAQAISSLAQQTHTDIGIVRGHAEQLPFADGCFDLVLCRQALHHARDLNAMCREAARVLKPGGVFLAAREHVLSRAEDRQAFFDGHPLHRLYGGENAYTLDEYLSAIRQAGIELTHILNPLQSAINYAPRSRSEVAREIAGRFSALHRLLPDFLLTRAGERSDVPGRLYTFRGRRRI